jgi:hypothetical protein
VFETQWHYLFPFQTNNMIMKSVKWVVGALCVFQFFLTEAQDQNKNAAAGQTNTRKSTSGSKAGAQPTDGDSTKATNGKNLQPAQNAPNGATAAGAQPQGNSGQANNAAGVIETTSSTSGSPGMLSGKNGKQRDGTNNVQRASMNMEGSPVGNLHTVEGNVNTNTEIAKGQRLDKSRQAAAQKKSQKAAKPVSVAKKPSKSTTTDVSNQSKAGSSTVSDQPKTSKDQTENKAKKQNKKKRKG